MSWIRLLARGTAALVAALALLLLGLSLLRMPDDPTLEPVFDASTAVPAADLPRLPPDPERRALFGDLHIHSALSPDAYVFGVRAMPADAYRFAKGATIEHGNGTAIRLSRPLDFAAVTDHSEFLGTTRARDGDLTLSSRSLRDRLLHEGRLAFTFTWFRTLAELSGAVFRGGELPPELNEVRGQAWRTIIEAAEGHYVPGAFTTFIAYEWTSTADAGGHLHRNVIYGSSQVPDLPFSATDSNRPRELWRALDAQREAGMQVLAIPHNPNLSGGETFQLADREGRAFDAQYAETRRRNEPLTEIFQVKGTSETHPVLSSADEFANFEIHEQLVPGGEETADRRGSYARSALRLGLELQRREGFNPFTFGVIGSSDGHGASSPVEEDAFHGKLPMLDGSAAIRTGKAFLLPLSLLPAKEWGAAGLAGVWAEENTRESIFAALKRKETFATSGPRMRVRFFGGWNFDGALPGRSDAVQAAYANGVPMGGTLRVREGEGEAAPGFLVWALKDPDGANLDRIQIVKAWVDETGASAERVVDVAASDGRRPDPGTGRLAPVGTTVDLATASYTNGIGAAELSAFWRDPEFDPRQEAFYYARVIEIPTPRWSTYDAVALGIATPEPATLQERAVTSAIWIAP